MKRIVWFLVLVFCIQSLLYAQRSSRLRRRAMIPPRWGSLPIEKNDRYMVATIIQDGVTDKNSQSLDMWTWYYVYKETPDHCFLGLPSEGERLEERLGWIDRKYLLTKSEALRTKNKIFRKILVFSSKKQNQIDVFTSTRSDAEVMNKTPRFAFFYIYKETKQHFLIGLTPQIDLEYCEQDILGWIPKKSSREWNTRQAVTYDLTSRHIRIWQHEKDKQGLVPIYGTLQSAKSKNKADIIARESPDIVWRYNMLRYPLLQSISYKQKRIFQIAFLGGKNSAAIQQAISVMKEAKQKLQKIDIMLVVDASSHVGHRQQIKDAIGSVINKYRKDEKYPLDIQVGINFYNDFSKGRRYRYRRGKIFQPKVVKLRRLTEDLAKFNRAIDRMGIYGKQDKPKSLYYAIDVSMSKRAKWRKGNSHFMVVLGYSGNHVKKYASTNISKLTLEDIKKPLEKNRIRLYALQMPSEVSSNKHTRRFLQQMASLTQDLGEGGVFPTMGPPDEAGEDLFLESLLDKILEQNKREIKIIQEGIASLERGMDLKTVIKRHQPRIGKICAQLNRELEALYRENNTPLSSLAIRPTVYTSSIEKQLRRFMKTINVNLQDLQKEDVAFAKGWVWEFEPKNNIKQIQVYLLLNKLELSRLLGFLSSLLTELKRASRPEQYLEIWKTLLKTTFGIDTIPASEPMENLMKQHTGLPFVNGLLNYTLEDFVKKAQRPQFRKQLLKNLEQTCSRLFDVLSDKEMEHVVDPNSSVTMRKKKRWWREEGTDVDYAWIEVELFP